MRRPNVTKSPTHSLHNQDSSALVLVGVIHLQNHLHDDRHPAQRIKDAVLATRAPALVTCSMSSTNQHLRPITIRPEAIPRAFTVIRTSLQHPNAVLEHIYRALQAVSRSRHARSALCEPPASSPTQRARPPPVPTFGRRFLAPKVVVTLSLCCPPPSQP